MGGTWSLWACAGLSDPVLLANALSSLNRVCWPIFVCRLFVAFSCDIHLNDVKFYVPVSVMVVEKVSTNQEEISFPEQTNRPDWLGGSKTGFDLPLQQNNSK